MIIYTKLDLNFVKSYSYFNFLSPWHLIKFSVSFVSIYPLLQKYYHATINYQILFLCWANFGIFFFLRLVTLIFVNFIFAISELTNLILIYS